MSELTFNHKPAYKNLIDKAFIEPIRTVVVVDDEFPSLDALINQRLAPDPKTKVIGDENFTKVGEILKFCRNRDLPWLVDVHDARSVPLQNEEKIAPHLHHSDLMILDYHLEGNDGNGDKAISILRKLASNNHFNLVIVYTNGYREQVSHQQIISEIGMGLTYPQNLPIEKDEEEKFLDEMEEWEIYDNGIVDRLIKELSVDLYLKVRNVGTQDCRSLLGFAEADSLKAMFAKKPRTMNIGHLVNWLVREWQNRHLKEFAERSLGDVQYFFSESCSWLKTERMFLTVVSKKNHAPNELTEILLNALCSSCPSPHHLLMAKMRSEIDKTGICGESITLNNKYILTGWLEELVDKSINDKVKLVKKTFSRHWDALADNIQLDINNYTNELLLSLRDEPLDSLKKHFRLEKESKEKSKVLKWINHYNSNKSFDRAHLTTGHILKIPSENTFDSKEEYWVCLSPACDLVPGQKDSKFDGKILPFLAVKLHKISDDTALKRANENIFLFLDIDNNVECFSLNPGGEQKSAPNVENMYVENNGIFNYQSKEIIIFRNIVDSESVKDFRMTTKKVSTSVAGQLRYEYALNLLQRLGGSLSRIGLDFRANSQ